MPAPLVPVSRVVLLVLLGVVVFSAYALWCEVLFRRHRPGDEIVRAVTSDGCSLGLVHYRARGATSRAEPLILCHGLSANRYNLDLDDQTSLALYLAGRGFDVYLLDLRGRGLSRRGWWPTQSFDDYVDHDVPAAVAAVRARHGGARVSWVGHSMGGLVLYAYLARQPDAPIGAAVTVGSPLRFDYPWWIRGPLAVAAALPRLGPILQARAARLLAPLVGHVYPRIVRWLLHPEHTAPARVRLAVANLVADISGNELKHFAHMVRGGAFKSLRDGFDYGSALGAVEVPVLALAGSRDLMAPATSVREACRRLGGPARFRLLGRDAGDPVDFGHGDLLIGDHAPAVVFPEIADWLETHGEAQRWTS